MSACNLTIIHRPLVTGSGQRPAPQKPRRGRWRLWTGLGSGARTSRRRKTDTQVGQRVSLLVLDRHIGSAKANRWSCKMRSSSQRHQSPRPRRRRRDWSSKPARCGAVFRCVAQDEDVDALLLGISTLLLGISMLPDCLTLRARSTCHSVRDAVYSGRADRWRAERRSWERLAQLPGSQVQGRAQRL